MIKIEIPGYKTIQIKNLVMDYNGTLALDGHLYEGVGIRLKELANTINLYILTADTFGLVEKGCAGLPVKIKKLEKGNEANQKRSLIEQLGPDFCATIGNGANDYEMLKHSCLSVVVLGGEGTCRQTLEVADIIVPDICIGLDLFFYPKRIIATLRR